MIKAKKSFGQHFLKSLSVLRAIVDAAEIEPGEHILEIGPGKGALTQALVEAGADVLAIEADRDLIPILEERFGDTIELVQGDALKLDLVAHGLKPEGYKLVANLPYNVASEILEQFLKSDVPPLRLVVMVQKEVGDRMLASPGDMSVLSVATQIYTDPHRVIKVPPGAFNPPPKVDSSVLKLDRNVKAQNPEEIIALAKIGFSSRRKQLHRNLNDKGVAPSSDVKLWLSQIGLPETARAQELSVEDWIGLKSQMTSTK